MRVHAQNSLVNMALARKYVLRSHFSGFPKREDLEIVEETLPPIQDGGQWIPPIFSAAAVLGSVAS